MDKLFSDQVIYAATIGSDPERAFAVAKYVSHSHAGQRGETIGRSLVLLKAKQVGSGDPNIVVEILIDGFSIGIGRIRQFDRSHWSLAEAQHARLRSNPNILFDIFEQIQDGIARQFVGRCDRGKSIVAVNVKPVTDRTNP